MAENQIMPETIGGKAFRKVIAEVICAVCAYFGGPTKKYVS